MMRKSDVQFIYDLVENVPNLRPLLDEHLEDNYDEVLPHLFLADVLRAAIAEPLDPTVAPVIAYLERAFQAGDNERQELISTGFVENLPTGGEPGADIRARLGPGLHAEAQRVS
jgi:hypothetical protein